MYSLHFKKSKTNIFLFITLAMITGSYACTSADKETPGAGSKVIEVVTQNMDFQAADTITAGWNTFRYINMSEEPHFFLLDKYPAGKNIEDGRKEVIPIFQKGMDLINQGKPAESQAAFTKLPGWFSEVTYPGGCGLVSPGESCDVTLNLEPGYYVMECYVKMPNGTFHAAMGMTKAFTVTETNSGNIPPTADHHISISKTDGIVFTDSVEKGEKIFAVYFKDQAIHEHFVGHDVNLVKLSDTASMEALEKWMNWADPKGLISPSPGGITFLGGVNDMLAGDTGYFKANLVAGKYALISEVPDPSGKGMLKTFTVAD